MRAQTRGAFAEMRKKMKARGTKVRGPSVLY
jgi:hypothetical protein